MKKRKYKQEALFGKGFSMSADGNLVNPDGKEMKKIPRKKREEGVQAALALYIKMNYPDVIFTAESSGLKVTIGQAVKMKNQRSKGKLPDVLILEPRGTFAGLVIELKHDDIDIGKALLSDAKRWDHLKEQHLMLERLATKGYQSAMLAGFDACKKMVDKYMALPVFPR